MDKDYKKLVDMIDNCIKNGSGHINVKTGEVSNVENCATGCCEGGACSVPTLHKDIDD
ncbi:MAG: hypothetical protein KIG65_03135 [Eubacteriales bacterium]|nr:hypothetical protein [Eubacteriales bacterium]